jgi:DNA-binding response OmpR family regulator
VCPEVLVVADDAQMVELVAESLKTEGMDVAVAQDVPSAVEAARDRRWAPRE